MIYLACFDVSDDKQRRNVIKALEKFGRRIQYSVFELEMAPSDFVNLKAAVKRMRLDENDKLFIFPIDEKCLNRAFFLGVYTPIERVYVF